MPSILVQLKAEKEKYDNARNALDSALSSANNLKSYLRTAVREINSGVKGTGLNEGLLVYQENYADNVVSNIGPMIEYCKEKSEEYEKLILQEQARLLTPLKHTTNNSPVASAILNRYNYMKE